MSEWTLTREPALGQTVFGLLTMGQPASVVNTLERLAVQIPEGRYQIVLTVSQRALAGHLWCPDRSMRLPLLLTVPLRTGIRIHAGNKALDSDGCVLVGMKRIGMELQDSRPALVKVYNLLNDLATNHDDAYLTVSTIHAPIWSQPTSTEKTV